MNLMIGSKVLLLKGFAQRVAASRLASLLLLCVFFWMVAAASFAGFVGKWGLRDESKLFGIESMFDATAHKPFVYRQLVPMLSNLANQIIPNEVKKHVTAKIRPEETFARLTSLANPELRFRYVVVYYIIFISLFLSLFVLRQVALDAGAGRVAAVIAPISLVLAFPYFQTLGGYFYDSTELFFLSLSFLLAYRGRGLLLIALVLPATLNKESFFFFLPALYPLLRRKFSMRKALVLITAAIITAGIVNVLMKLVFIEAPGGVAEFTLLKNLENYLEAWTYIDSEITYGIVGPGKISLGTLAVILIIVLRSWPNSPPEIKWHLLVAAAINFPLFLTFATTGELRNLSFLFVGFMILVASAIEKNCLTSLEKPINK